MIVTVGIFPPLDQVSGFVCQLEDDLVRAVEHIPDLDRGRCRAEAERRFSPAAMADAYEIVYVGLLKGAAPSEPAVYAPDHYAKQQQT